MTRMHLVKGHRAKTALMCVEISPGHLLKMHKLKNTCTTDNLHIDQRNVQSAAQISVVANKEATVDL